MNCPVLAYYRSDVSFDPINHFPAQTDLVTWCQEMGIGTAILLMLMGVVYLLYGWSAFKTLITLNAAILGGYIGVLCGQRAGGYDLIGGGLGAVVSALVAWFLMKWAVAVVGGICGAVVGASIWRACGQEASFAWAGAMTGLVGFGLFSFILFRGSIIMYTSLQGSLMLIVGMLGLFFKWPEIAPSIDRHMSAQSLVLPIAVIVPAIIGLIFQQTHSTGGASEGGGGGGGGGGEKKK